MRKLLIALGVCVAVTLGSSSLVGVLVSGQAWKANAAEAINQNEKLAFAKFHDETAQCYVYYIMSAVAVRKQPNPNKEGIKKIDRVKRTLKERILVLGRAAGINEQTSGATMRHMFHKMFQVEMNNDTLNFLILVEKYSDLCQVVYENPDSRIRHWMAVAGMDEGIATAKRGDYATALKSFRALAEQGDSLAQNTLGLMYEHSYDVAQDYKEAVKWYRKAAEQGIAQAQHNLGWMYYKGYGVAQDDKEAVKWYRKAAEQGNASAQGNLGVMYLRSRGVTQDNVQAHMWYSIGAENGNENAKKGQDYVEKLMTATDISKARKLAEEWMVKHQK